MESEWATTHHFRVLSVSGLSKEEGLEGEDGVKVTAHYRSWRA